MCQGAYFFATAMLTAAWRGRASFEVGFLALASALALLLIDVIYVARGVISPIYLADAALEATFAASWARLLVPRSGATAALRRS